MPTLAELRLAYEEELVSQGYTRANAKRRATVKYPTPAQARMRAARQAKAKAKPAKSK
jgi:hypothetical protein